MCPKYIYLLINCIEVVNQWSLAPIQTGISNLGCSEEGNFSANSSMIMLCGHGNTTAVEQLHSAQDQLL